MRLERLRAELDRMASAAMSLRSSTSARRLLAPRRTSATAARAAIGRLAAYDGLMLEATGFDRPIGAGARDHRRRRPRRAAPKWSASAATAPC